MQQEQTDVIVIIDKTSKAKDTATGNLSVWANICVIILYDINTK